MIDSDCGTDHTGSGAGPACPRLPVSSLPAAPLTAGRSAALRELFDVFKPTDGAIALAGLAGVNMKAGAAEIKLLKELGDMDFDGDGLLTFDEMCSYFAQVGTALNDEEFDLIVEEMRTAATAYALAMTLQE